MNLKTKTYIIIILYNHHDKNNIGKLKDGGIIRRVGSAKSGHWEILP